MLKDRVVSWLGCNDFEIDEIQRLLNSGTDGASFLPGVMVIDNYFSVTNAERRCRVAGALEEQPRQASHWDWQGLGASMNQMISVVSKTVLCTCASREREVGPRRAGRDDGQAPASLRPLPILEESPQLLLHEIDLDEGDSPSSVQSDSSKDYVMYMMWQERHPVACNGCDRRVVGKRLKCQVCEAFNLCEACTERPLHWPGSPLKAHLATHPVHHFVQVSLPVLHCPWRHRVEPGEFEKSEVHACNACGGPLQNGLQTAGQGPQFRCEDPACGFVLCASCYWARRQTLAAREPSPSWDQGTHLCSNGPTESENAATCSKPKILRCHFLFSSPLCIGHTVRVPFLVRRTQLISPRPTDAWGLDFSSDRPSIVQRLHPVGLVATWNQRQHAVQNLVRPGDALIQISAAGTPKPVMGKPPADVLRCLCEELIQREKAAALPCTNDELQIDLFFSGMRSLPTLQVENEIASLQNTGCEFIARAATTENIRHLIAAGDCSVLHFSFHTSSDQSQRVFLEDIHGKAHVLTVQEFRNLVTNGQPLESRRAIRLVFISSCHSYALGQDLAAAGFRHVVCIRSEDSVLDTSCLIFERHFFTALGTGSCVQQAFMCGVAALSSSPIKRLREDGSKFVLLPEDANHDEVFVETHTQPSGVSPVQESETWGALPARVEDYVGRDVDIYRLLVLLRDGSYGRRFVLLHGEEGIGKTVLMAELGRFVKLRRGLFDEVRWLGLPQYDRDDILKELKLGLQSLRRRLVTSPQRRALLLVDNPNMMFWGPLQRLLVFPTVHTVLAITSTAAMMADLNEEALILGTKPVRFHLGSLEPLCQAWLFARRAARAIYACEVWTGKVGAGGSLPETIWTAQKPADYLALAESPLVCPHGGNPRRIAAAALALELLPSSAHRSPPSLPLRSVGCLDEGDVSGGPPCCGHRRVCFVFPDGREHHEWCSCKLPLRGVLEQCPHVVGENLEVFFNGRSACLDKSLSEIVGNGSNGLLRLELCHKSKTNLQ